MGALCPTIQSLVISLDCRDFSLIQLAIRQWHRRRSTLCKFADDTKLSDAVDMAKGWDAIQRDLDKLKRWAHEVLMMFNKDKCKVLHVGQGNPRDWYKMEYKGIESNPNKEGLGGLDMNWGCVLDIFCKKKKWILHPWKYSRSDWMELGEQPGPAENIPAHGEGVGLYDF